jgi:hypothetical protein
LRTIVSTIGVGLVQCYWTILWENER